MKAIVRYKYGSPDVLELREIDTPKIGDDEGETSDDGSDLESDVPGPADGPADGPGGTGPRPPLSVTAVAQPHKADSFILLSAGADGFLPHAPLTATAPASAAMNNGMPKPYGRLNLAW